MELFDDYERSCMNLDLCTIQGNLIRLLPRETNGKSLLWNVGIRGIAGEAPTFEVYIDNMWGGKKQFNSSVGYRAFYSTDDRVTWQTFLNGNRGQDWYEFSNGSTFTSDEMIIAMSRLFSRTELERWAPTVEAHTDVYETLGSTGRPDLPPHVFNEIGSQTDELGRRIPEQPLRSWLIGSGTKNVVLASGVHSAEDTGTWIMKGWVDFILSNHQIAERYRTLFTTLVCPIVNVSGRVGGHSHHTFEGKGDPNRYNDWPKLEVMTKWKAHFDTEMDRVDAIFDCHAWNSYALGVYKAGDDLDNAFHIMLNDHNVAPYTPLGIYGLQHHNNLTNYFRTNRGAVLGHVVEASNTRSVGPGLESVGAAYAKALVDAHDAGMFGGTMPPPEPTLEERIADLEDRVEALEAAG